jgi:outer membrane protein TolC
MSFDQEEHFLSCVIKGRCIVSTSRVGSPKVEFRDPKEGRTSKVEVVMWVGLRGSGIGHHLPLFWNQKVLLILALMASASTDGWAQTTNTNVYPIDLPTALRLAGAQNLDVQIARERLREAEANRASALEQFFPWVSPGVGYHRRDGVAQAVPSGIISDAHYQSYAPGATLTAQVALGDAIYNSLASRQLVKASDQGLEAQRQDSAFNAARAYFDLAKAKALIEVVKETLRISQDYQQQLHTAVASGIAFKGDELRVQTQGKQIEISLRQAFEQQRQSGVALALLLHLDPKLELVSLETGLAQLTLFEPESPLDSLVARALVSRPELKQSQAMLVAADDANQGAIYGPLIPSIGAQVFGGGLGGGPDGGPSNFGAAGDYTVGLSWRIGPGGLFDSGRVHATQARLAVSKLSEEKIKDVIASEVVSSLVRVQSLRDQIGLVQANLASANETLRLTRERKQFGVGVVVEDIQAQQDLERARSDYVRVIADYNTAQFSLSRAVGGPAAPESLTKR